MKLGGEKQKSFRRKFIYAFLVITTIPLLLVAGSNFYLVDLNREQNVLEYQKLALDNAEDKISRFFNQKIDNLQMKVSADIESLYLLPADNLYFLMNSAFEQGHYQRLDMIDDDGNILAAINEEGHFSLSRIYDDAIASTSPYRTLLDEFISSNNVVMISRTEGSVATLPDYRVAIEGSDYFGEKEVVGGKPVMRIASQIINSSGEIIGVIAAEIMPDDLQVLIENIQLGNDGGIIILNNKGSILYQNSRSPYEQGENIINISKIRELLQRKMIGIEQYESYPLGDGYRTISGKHFELLDWYIITDWSVDDAFSVVGNLFKITFYIFISIILLVVVIALVFSGQVIKPIRKLTDGVKKIREGKLDHKIDMQTGDEFQLLGEQFNEMVDALKENKELRDQFVFVAAHELRTPVTAIKGYLSMVLEGTFGEVNDKTKDALKIVNDSNERLVQLVQDLLEIARSEAGRMKIELKNLDIAELINITRNELKSLSDEKGIAVDYEAEGKVMIMADQAKLQEVLVNIVGNAIKYTLGDGAIKIWHEDDGEFVVTHIKDHGIGMTKEEIEQLFSKFYRAQNEDTAGIQGTGLGLFICKEIINKMEGDIWVESKKGEGSVFSFKLKKGE